MKGSKIVGMIPFYLLAVIMSIGLTQLGSKTVTTIASSQPVRREHTIIIDAGHGGVDGGATSCTGVLESAFNLQIALRLDDLMHLFGCKTVMIRKTDVSVYTAGETIAAKKISDLKERARIINETDGALLISIHQNTFSDSRYHGAQVFYAPTENSMELAKVLQSSLINTINPGSNRQVKKADGVYLMNHIQRTGVLIECGFLSNPEEEAKLRSEQYQKELCAVIASCVSEFLIRS